MHAINLLIEINIIIKPYYIINMKKLVFIFFCLISSLVYSQDLPTEASNGFSFPIGSKFTIKLINVDSNNYDYSIIEFENFQEIVNSWETDSLFAKNGDENTISFYFCLGTHGDTPEEKEKNMKVHLLMKNYTDKAFSYISEIQTKEDGEYEPTSNIGTFPKAVGNEMWPYMIYFIGLRDFKAIK